MRRDYGLPHKCFFLRSQDCSHTDTPRGQPLASTHHIFCVWLVNQLLVSVSFSISLVPVQTTTILQRSAANTPLHQTHNAVAYIYQFFVRDLAAFTCTLQVSNKSCRCGIRHRSRSISTRAYQYVSNRAVPHTLYHTLPCQPLLAKPVRE